MLNQTKRGVTSLHLRPGRSNSRHFVRVSRVPDIQIHRDKHPRAREEYRVPMPGDK